MKSNEKDKTKKVGEIKSKIPGDELCKDLPIEFQQFLEYSKSINFHEPPDYNYLFDLFKKMAKNNNFELNCCWDWSKNALKSSFNLCKLLIEKKK